MCCCVVLLKVIRLGGTDALLYSLFVALSQRNFVQGLRIKELVQIWKNLHKINDVIHNDVIIVKKHAETTVERSYFKIAASFIQSY